jgi:hypothetical protein
MSSKLLGRTIKAVPLAFSTSSSAKICFGEATPSSVLISKPTKIPHKQMSLSGVPEIVFCCIEKSLQKGRVSRNLSTLLRNSDSGFGTMNLL